jgi:hypothetical protein
MRWIEGFIVLTYVAGPAPIFLLGVVGFAAGFK